MTERIAPRIRGREQSFLHFQLNSLTTANGYFTRMSVKFLKPSFYFAFANRNEENFIQSINAASRLKPANALISIYEFRVEFSLLILLALSCFINIPFFSSFVYIIISTLFFPFFISPIYSSVYRLLNRL